MTPKPISTTPAAERAAGILDPGPVAGVVEWTLPYGMADGNGLVRLTVYTEVVPDTHERRIRVVVAAAARAWHQDDGRVSLPRFTDWGATYVRPSRERSSDMSRDSRVHGLTGAPSRCLSSAAWGGGVRPVGGSVGRSVRRSGWGA
ncbi:hypothetical protein [Streptomyces fungicidicus]|uniref:hypothetical protein n=1 Tax=Streptomyces fungicidicus TaxID=68203 RepID=UPI0038133048